jgi:imidazolonepropionase-like amidohydrolase
LGVVEEGAYADLLLIDGNPLEDLSVLGANSKWWNANAPKDIETMCVIMKGGNIVKNTA